MIEKSYQPCYVKKYGSFWRNGSDRSLDPGSRSSCSVGDRPKSFAGIGFRVLDSSRYRHRLRFRLQRFDSRRKLVRIFIMIIIIITFISSCSSCENCYYADSLLHSSWNPRGRGCLSFWEVSHKSRKEIS